jgi:hypothetical protein
MPSSRARLDDSEQRRSTRYADRATGLIPCGRLIGLLAGGPEAENDWSGFTRVQFRIWKSDESTTTSAEQSSQVCAPRTPFASLI